MIYREQMWRKGNVGIVEIIPADGYELPPTFKRFRLRVSAQGFTHVGPVTSARDVILGGDNLKDAMAEAEQRFQQEQDGIMEELSKEMSRIMQAELEKAVKGKRG